MESTTKTISLINSDNFESNNIKTVSILDSEDITQIEKNTKTISNLESNLESNKEVTTIQTNDISFTTLNATTEKMISFLDSDSITDYTKNETSTILDESTKCLVMDKLNQTKQIGFNTISQLLKIPKNTCIKYKFKTSNFKWGILSDIILFENNTILILSKGPHIWKHTINFKYNIYYYQLKI